MRGPGRNDPCPCGSGRKYKRCHLMEESREHTLRNRLLDFARSLPAENDRALRDFLGAPGERAIDEAEGILFLSYLTLDHRTKEGETILERFLRERAGDLSDQDRAILTPLLQGRWGIFEVEDVHPGQGVELKDLLTDEHLDVRDVSASKGLLRWQIIFGRLIPGRGSWVGDGSLMGFDPHIRNELMETLAKLGLRKGSPDASALLAQKAAQVQRALRDLQEKPPYERAVTLEGDPVAECTARYSTVDGEKVLEALDKIADLYPAGPDDNGRLVYNWARPEREVQRPEGLEIEKGLCLTTYLVPASAQAKRAAKGEKLVNLATIAVGPRDLHVDAVSEVRFDAALKIVENLGLPFKLTVKRVKPLDVVKAFTERGERGKYGADRQDAETRDSAISQAEQERMRRKLVKEFLATWPTTPIKSLGGLTPAEAAAGEQKKSDVVDLVKELEFHATSGHGILEPADVRTLARRLGLPWPPPGAASTPRPKARPSSGTPKTGL